MNPPAWGWTAPNSAFLVQAGLAGGSDHALACLLALNALRVSEACDADIDDVGHAGRPSHPAAFRYHRGADRNPTYIVATYLPGATGAR